MTWAKLDDRANEHEKQLAAGPRACWLWACGLMYCNRQAKKVGRIPKAIAHGMLYPGLSQKDAAKLVETGLWHDVGDAYEVHQFHGWNPEKRDGEPSNLSEKRAEAGRLGGLAKASKSLANEPSNLPDTEPGKQVANDSGKNLARIQTRVGSTPPHSDPPHSQAAASSETSQVVGAEAQRQQQPQQDKPRNLEQALALPVCARAELVTKDPYSAQWLEPAKWPEVVRVAKAFATATGRTGDARLGSYQADAGLRAIVERFAEGWAPSDLEAAARALPGTELARMAESEGRRLGLSSLTPEVLRRMEPEQARPVSALVTKLARDINLGRSEREAGGVK